MTVNKLFLVSLLFLITACGGNASCGNSHRYLLLFDVSSDYKYCQISEDANYFTEDGGVVTLTYANELVETSPDRTYITEHGHVGFYIEDEHIRGQGTLEKGGSWMAGPLCYGEWEVIEI